MRILGIVLATTAWLGSLTLFAQIGSRPSLMRNHPAIAYGTAPASDAVARLGRRLAEGSVTLERNEGGYLGSLLRALDISVESQLLVFSKTSFQAPRIHPGNPRAIYFNDDVAVGWVRGGDVLELVAHDPSQGSIFYVLKQNEGGTPKVTRDDAACVSCHVSDATENVPGWFVGSVFPASDGTTRYGPAYTTDHRSPFELRWGGWYVTGTHRAERHMGNAIAHDPSDLAAMITPATVHRTNLDGQFDRSGYLTPHSDIVALLVLEHQSRMLNLITRVGWEARLGKDADRPLEKSVTELVDYLLFVDEAPLPGPIAGPSGFASTFSARGPRDGKGRSLRDLDLDGRLFRYPCSYLIYSEAFDALPATAKSAVYARLWEILSGKATGAPYARLTAADRTAIVQILKDTKPDLPDYFDAES